MMVPIEKIESNYGTINILKSRSTGAVLYELEGYRQSMADTNGTSLAPYIHAIFGLLSQAKARNILLIGGAGGTLATMLARTRRKAIIVDINPLSRDLARQYFHLPETVAWHVADGEAFLRAHAEHYDAIVLDAYHGQHIPTHLLTRRFFGLVREHLTPTGAVFVNVHVKHDFDDYPDRVAKTMTDIWSGVRVLDAVGLCDRNAIVMAGAVSHLRAPGLLVRPATNASGIDDELARLQFRAWKVSRWDFGR